MLKAKHFLHQFLGVRRLFSRGGGQESNFAKKTTKNMLFFSKKLKTYYFWPAFESGARAPLPPLRTPMYRFESKQWHRNIIWWQVFIAVDISEADGPEEPLVLVVLFFASKTRPRPRRVAGQRSGTDQTDPEVHVVRTKFPKPSRLDSPHAGNRHRLNPRFFVFFFSSKSF